MEPDDATLPNPWIGDGLKFLTAAKAHGASTVLIGTQHLAAILIEVEQLIARIDAADAITDELRAHLTTSSAALQRVIEERDRLREALASIAQYDKRWTGQHVNDAPNREQLIAKAFDARAALSGKGET